VGKLYSRVRLFDGNPGIYSRSAWPGYSVILSQSWWCEPMGRWMLAF
jgi:hypothetical protein